MDNSLSNVNLNDFIKQKVTECLEAESFASLNQEEQEAAAEKIIYYLYSQVFDTVINNLTEQQATEIENLAFEDTEFQDRLQNFVSESPDIAYEIEDKVLDEVDSMKQTGQVPQI